MTEESIAKKALNEWQKDIKELQEQNKILAKHILELQADKGRLTDELSEAKKIIHKVCYEFGVYDKDLMEKAKQFLKENSTYERIQRAKYNYTN